MDSNSYRCPYPNCDWGPSRPVDADNGLTQAVVSHEIKTHRETHMKAGRQEADYNVKDDEMRTLTHAGLTADQARDLAATLNECADILESKDE